MEPSMKDIHAKIAELAYEKRPPGMINMGGGVSLVLDKKDGDQSRFRILGGKNSGQTVVGVAGTHSLGDALTDVKLALGFLPQTKRFKDAEKFVKETMDQKLANAAPGSEKPTLAGHSLGSGIISEISDRYKLTGSAFNPAITPQDLKRGSSQIKQYVVEKDPVSYLLSKIYKGGGTEYHKGDGSLLNRHRISNFT